MVAYMTHTCWDRFRPGDGWYVRQERMVTTTSGTRRFPSVTVQSERPSATGRVVKGLSGTGVIMADEPNVVYVTAMPNATPQWYGHWPLEETDLQAVLAQQQRQERLTKAGADGEPRVYSVLDGEEVLRAVTQNLAPHQCSPLASQSAGNRGRCAVCGRGIIWTPSGWV